MSANKPAYRSSTKQVLEHLRVSQKTGLDVDAASVRLDQYGENALQAAHKIHPFRLFVNQFKDVLVIILLAAAAVSWGVGLLGSDDLHRATNVQYAEFKDNACGSSDTEGVSLNCSRLVSASVIDGETVQPTRDERNYDVYCDSAGECQLLSAEEAPAEEHSGREALLILGIVVAIALIGFFNEYKAERTVEALRKLVGQKAKVRRAGKVVEVDAVDLVPGDIVLLEEGDKVPADIRLLQVKSLYVNEASLTGESVPVSKDTLAAKTDKGLGDQKSMAFAGTFITQGTAEGVVTSTGQSTELGKIAQLVNDVEEEQTPMQRKLDDLGKKLGLFIIVICIAVFVIVFAFVEEAQNQEVLQRAIFAFTAAVALAVAAIPEGLAFVVRISLALGARRMAAKDALVRKLSAVEALGSTDVICSDKTGTLTRGQMTVRKLYVAGSTYDLSGAGYDLKGSLTKSGKSASANKAVMRLLHIGAVCNNAHLKNGIVLGDPTEGALLVSAQKLGIDDEVERSAWRRTDEMPFTSERKKMSVLARNPDGGYEIVSKGAVERVLEMCDYILTPTGAKKKITSSDKKKILSTNKRLASQALRVLAFACRDTRNPLKGKSMETGLTFVGLQAMMDPPRDEVKEVIHRVHAESGIRVVMITGDYIETAKAVAKEIGIEGDALSGADIEAMSLDEFEVAVEHTSVYARVNPEHKIRIVQALKKHGHQVAMTGDGVNDAPAIKAADIGIAMGITGTDATKEAADLILLDDQFLTIIDAIEEGRGIFDNVRKFVNFLISCNIAEVLAVLVGILIFNDLILTAAQLLFINIVTDGLPAVALGSDPSQSDALRQKPAHYQEPILNKRTWVEIFVFGSLMTIALVIQYWYNIDTSTKIQAVSAAFTAMVIYEFIRLVDIRTDYRIKWFSNPWLSVAMAGSLILHFSVVYFGPLADYFGVGPLQAHDWIFMGVGSVVLFVIMKALNPLFDLIGSEAKYKNPAI